MGTIQRAFKSRKARVASAGLACTLRKLGGLYAPMGSSARSGESRRPISRSPEEIAVSPGGDGWQVAKARGIEGPDGQQSKIRREPTPDLSKSRKICSIAGVVDGVLAGAQHVPAIAAVRVFDNACAPVPRGHMCHSQVAMPIAVPPIEFDHIAEAEVGHQIKDMVRHNNRGRSVLSTAGL